MNVLRSPNERQARKILSHLTISNEPAGTSTSMWIMFAGTILVGLPFAVAFQNGINGAFIKIDPPFGEETVI